MEARALGWLVVVAAGCGEVRSADVDATPPAGEERCTPSDATSAPADEDGDGAIDEGCTWHFGKPHWLAPLDGTAGDGRRVFPDWLSPDGQRLYLTSLVSGTASKIMVATRAGRDQPFGPPVDLRGTGLPDHAVVTIALSDDELEAFVAARPVAMPDADTDLYRMVRTSKDGDFGELERLEHLSTEDDEEGIALRADGLEIVYAADRVLLRAVRSAPGGAFGAPVPLEGVPASGINAPQLSRDGRTLFYYRPPADRPFRIFRAERADPSSVVFAAPEEVTELEPSGQHEVFHPLLATQTREIFFGSTQPWSPTFYAIWRAEICRDGACASRLVMPCAGIRSDDGLHCYSKLDAVQGQAAAEAACRTAGGHLASITSRAEQDFLWRSFGGEHLWIGSYDDRGDLPECNRRGLDGSVAWPCPWAWEDGTRWSYAAWGEPATSELGFEPQEQGNEDCAAMFVNYDGLWADLPCGHTYRAICETTLYPVW
jgi:hypothetical protein